MKSVYFLFIKGRLTKGIVKRKFIKRKQTHKRK